MRFPMIFGRVGLESARFLFWRNSGYGNIQTCTKIVSNIGTPSCLMSLRNFSVFGGTENIRSASLLIPAHTMLQTQTRNHWRQRRSKHVPYTKPLNFDFSGDLDMSVGEVDLKSPKVEFEEVPELKKADEAVQKVFSLEYSPYADVMDKKISEMLKKVREHPLDIQTLEVKIAKLTIQIRHNIEHCLRYRHDKVTKQRLIRMINVRKSMLRQLQMSDIDKFDWLTQELKLQLVEKPEGFKWPSKAEKRKEAAMQLAMAQARAKTEKLMKALEEQKVAFQKYKELELADIERGMKELGLQQQNMSSIESALTALDRAHMIPRAAPVISREEQMRKLTLEKNMPIKKRDDDELLRLHGFYTPDELKYYPDPIAPTPSEGGDK